jgi:hypothetical protein
MEALVAEAAWLRAERADWALDREFHEMERAAYIETLAELEVRDARPAAHDRLLHSLHDGGD